MKRVLSVAHASQPVERAENLEYSNRLACVEALFILQFRQFFESPCILIYLTLLTPWCRVLLEKLTGLQLVKKFPVFHGTRRFNNVLTSVRHLSLSWANPIQSTYPHPSSWRSILILSTHLRLGLPSGLFPSGFPTKTLYAPLSSPIRATCPAHGARDCTFVIAAYGV